MPASNLESRVNKLERLLLAFSKELGFALRYIQSDAASSLTKSRVVLEKVLVQVYTSEMGQEPRRPLLGNLLTDNQFTRKIERRILSRMNTIRDMGNLGPHGEAVEPSDAARVLDDLCEVLDRYLRHYDGEYRCADEGESRAPDRPSSTAQMLVCGLSEGCDSDKLRTWISHQQVAYVSQIR
jgi:hypothetical protein